MPIMKELIPHADEPKEQPEQIGDEVIRLRHEKAQLREALQSLVGYRCTFRAAESSLPNVVRDVTPQTYAALMEASDADGATKVVKLCGELERKNAMLLAAMEKIVSLAGTEDNEWDCVERIVPEMVSIALRFLPERKAQR